MYKYFIIIFILILIIIYYIYVLLKYKSFVINIKRRTDRLNTFDSSYFLPIKYNVFDGVDGNNINIEEYYKNNIIDYNTYDKIKNNKDREFHYEINTKGAIGCYLSHVNLWKHIVKNNIEYAIIFEDDCEVSNISIINIDIRLNILPNDWNIYLLNYFNSKYDKKLVYNKLYKVNRFFGLVAYIINLKTAKLLINNNSLFPIKQQIDSYLSDLALNIYIHNYKNYESFDSETNIHTLRNKNDKKILSFDSLINR